ncbi:unnamed protein product [Miscanthus lutarioriparius]|uniref:Uncharacterized protein n=1 Tax=Miscanthus lutarioriparius TaxID=422564 RepID=A0A811RN00_9POAL|nr:unnamed protein product [Miscanthus lutarioriparius]
MPPQLQHPPRRRSWEPCCGRQGQWPGRRGGGGPSRRGSGIGTGAFGGGDGDAAEICGFRVIEKLADAVAIRAEVKAELREEGPEAAPAAREHAGPRGLGGGDEAQKDVDKEIVGKGAEAVLAVSAGG